MIERIREHIAEILPLKIATAEWDDYALVVNGHDRADSDWGLTFTSPWRVSRSGQLLFSSASSAAADQVWELIGHDVVDVVVQSKFFATDPAFLLSEGLALEVFSDTEIDPWVLRLPSMTFVG